MTNSKTIYHCEDPNELTSKYVISPLDGNRYCRQNGQFKKHIKSHGFDTYEDLFIHLFPDQVRVCECGKPCTFVDVNMTYKSTCGSRECTNRAISNAKQKFTEKQWAAQRSKYQTAMSLKTNKELQDIKHRREQTYIEHYGVDHPWKLKTIRDQIATKLSQRYGTDNYSSSLISESSRQLLADSNWLYTEHVTKQKPLYVIAEELKVSDRTVGVYLKKHGHDTTNFQRSQWEREIESFLKSHGILTQTNDRNIIPPKEIDIYLPEYNIGIELCGLYWHTDGWDRIDRNYHADKFNDCLSKGVRLLTIFDDEWKKNKRMILNKLLYMTIKQTRRIYARTTNIVTDIKKTEREQFMNEHHIQGNGKGSIVVGLSHNDAIVAMMIFRKNQSGYLLNRFCTSVTVVGGFSKLLKWFIDTYNPLSIDTFADHRWSTGNLYTINGFAKTGTIKPDYMYVRRGVRVHKFNYRHRNLRKLLNDYDPTLSESQNCRNHGIYKVWDCGKTKFTWRTNS